MVSVLTLSRDVIAGTHSTDPSSEESRLQRCEAAFLQERIRAEERKLIARELHDELGQQMTALRMGLSLLRLQFGADNPALVEQVERLVALSDEAIQSVRMLATRMRNSAMHSGLYPALQRLGSEFAQQTGISCQLYLAGEELEIDENRATAIFRIVQESLTNVTRHAEATRVVVTLKLLDGDWLLEIFDNGRGFDLKSVKRTSLGLVGMRERSMTLGGPVIIFSHPGQGTTIQAFIPVSNSGVCA